VVVTRKVNDMAEYIESKCRDCFNLAPCAAWIHHGSMLYSDFSYSVEGCNYFVSAADVTPVVRCRECKHITPVEGGLPLCTLHNIARAYNDFCSDGARMDGAVDG